MAPELGSASHLWMRRQLEALAPETVGVITTRGNGTWVPDGIKVVEMPYTRGRGPITARALRLLSQARMAWEARNRSASAVLVHYLTTATALRRAWGWMGQPVFVHCHGYDVTWDLRDPESGRRRHSAEYVESVRRLATRVQFIANSNWTTRQLLSIGVPKDRIHVKYFGIETPAEIPDRKDRTDLNVLYLGRFVDFKGPAHVIRAFEQACEAGFKGTLSMAGDGPLFEECSSLRNASEFRKRIDLLGEVSSEEGMALRELADIFTAHNRKGPSGQEEAFGVSILEAMSVGLPFVGTRSGGVPEVVGEGETGILVEPGDVEGHAKALLSLERDSNLRGRMGLRAWERARSVFTVNGELEDLRDILFRRDSRNA